MQEAALGKLSSLRVAALNTPGRYGDGAGLWLQVSSTAVAGTVTKSWLLRYMFGGRARQMGLGSIDLVPLTKAREKARQARQLLADDIDPIDARNDRRAQQRRDAAGKITFEECATKYVDSHEAGWRNDKHRAQWRSTLSTYANPVIGHLAADAVDTALILEILEPIWLSKTETASRVRGRVERVLDWAKVRGFRSGENPARWKGHLETLLPSRSKVQVVRHHPALPYGDMPAFMADLRVREGTSARALEIAALTALRTNEVIGARWSEFDLQACVWTVPGSRMKVKREHRVPLCDFASEILSSLPRQDDSDFVFAGTAPKTHLSNMAMLELMRGMRPGYVPHGLRSTFRDWAAETTNHPNHVVEMALAHAIGDDVEAAYRRGDLFDKRKRLMRDWALYCANSVRATAKIVRLGA